MKSLFRSLSLLICLALLTAAVPMELLSAYASEAAEEQAAPAVEAILEEPPAPAEDSSNAGDANGTGDSAGDQTSAGSSTDAPPAGGDAAEPANPTGAPSAEPSVEASAEPSVEASVEPSVEASVEASAVPTDEASAEPTIEPAPAIDYTKSASYSPEFVKGFAVVLENDTAVYAGNSSSDEVVAWIGKGVVYAIGRTSVDSNKLDRLQVAFNVNPDADIATGWIDANAARPMDPAEGGEVEAYIDGCKGDERVRCYANDDAYPLRVIDCRYPAALEGTPEPVTMSLTQTSATIGVGDTGVTLGVVFSDGQTANADGTARAVKFSSSATKYVTVNATTGALKGVRRGSATITATTEYGTASCKVTVKSAPRTIKATPASAEILVGETTKISPKFASVSYGGSCTYQSSDPAIATVDANGNVTGASKGRVTIYVYAYNLPTKPAKATVTVYGPATAVDLSEDVVTLCSGMESQLSAILPEYEREAVVFSSSNSQVASVTEDGLVYAHSEGSATITATTVGTNLTGSCEVQVLRSPAEENVLLSANSYKLGLKEKFNVLNLIELTGGCHAAFTFKSSNTKYAKVDAEGYVTGMRAGSATISITTHNGIERKVKVTVYRNPTSVSFSPKAITLGVGMSAATKVKFNSTSAYSQHKFESGDPSVATVDPATGVVTAVGTGTTVIGCIPLKGKSGACAVTVVPAPEKISAAPGEINVGMGETGRSVTGQYPEGTLCSFTYKSQDESVVAVNAATGEITTVKPGGADIIVTSHNGATAVCRVNVLKAPEHLTLNKTTMKLMVGETNDTLTGTVDEGAASGLTFTSSNSRYVKVSGGKLVGVRAGTVTITAKTYNNKKATCKVTVCAKPTSVSFSSKAVSLGVGDSAGVTVKFNSTRAYSPCTFKSSDETVATIDPNTGVIAAHREGTATLTVTTLNGKTGTCAVNVLPAPEKISAAPGEINVGMGETGRSVTGQYPEGTLCSFTYKSQDESVVAVNAATGEITTVKPGSADIVVTSHNGATAVCRVNVMKAPEHLTLNKTSMKLMVGETNDTLTGTVDEGAASGLTFTSSNSRYVKVSGGKLVGVKAGTVTITAKTYNNKKATCKVTVCAKPTSVSFSSKTVALGVGDSAGVTVKFNSTRAYSPCTFKSSDETVATIDPNTGVIAAHREGTATLTVTTLNGKTGTCAVNVLPAPANISAAPGEINVGMGETGRSVTGQYPEGTLCSFTYKSQDESVVVVNAATGEITTVKPGSADIVVTSHNGATAVCRVNVMQAPTLLTLNKTTMKMMVGETNDTLTGTVDEGAASGLTFTSSNSRYVKVSGGKLVGVKAGTVTITAKTYNNKKATCKVTVYAAPKSVSFKTKSLTIGCGESVATAVTFNPTKSYSVCTASSSDEAIATVDRDTGVVTGVAPGTAIITATPQKGAAGTCTVVVCPAPTSVTLPQSTYALSQGMSLTLVPVLSAGAAGKCSFTSSDPDVVAVDADGTIKGLSSGSATITATTYNGISTSCAVTVTPAPAKVKYDFTKITMLKGDQIQIPVPTAYDVDGNPCPSSFTFKSSNTRYASISGGSVKGLKTGTVTVTATSYNGKKASFKLKIASTISGLALVPEKKTLYTNGADYVETLQLSVGTGSGAIATVTYVSSDPNIASVTPDGLVTPVNPGTATISAQVGGTDAGTATITVLRLSSSIGLDAMMEMGEGESFQLRPRLDEGASAIITYETSNANVASVDQNGLIRAGTIGEAVVTARMQDGRYAQTTVRVLPGPTGIRLNLSSVNLAVGERVVLTPQLTANDGDYCERVSFTSSDEGVVSIGEDGSIIALANGEAIVTARTCNGLTASCQVRVSDSAVVAFEKDNFGIICGDRGKLPVQLNKAAIERGYTLASSDETVLKIDGTSIVADPLRPGVVTVTLTVNPEAGAEDAEPMRASCTVNVCDFVQIDLPEEVSLPTNSELKLEYALMPGNLIGTYSFAPEDGNLISFDPETGIITSNGLTGTTNLVFKSFNDSFSCKVTVVSGAKYRALVVGSYNNSGSNNDLPFVSNNVNNVCSALSRAKFGEAGYSITSAAGNPSKSSLKSLITGTFREATDEDVSVIYIVTHGYYQATTSGYYGYYFSLAPGYSKANPNTYVTARELMNWISGIQGNVILVLDSCRSGGFIVDCSGSISSMGRLSVLTAQTYDQNASFYQGTSRATTVEFLTYAFCRGLGYDQMSGALPALNADRNGDGKVTVTEAFAYAKSDCEYQIGQKRGTFKETDSFSKWMAATSCIKVPGAYKREDFNAWYQSPQYRVAANGSELAICAR